MRCSARVYLLVCIIVSEKEHFVETLYSCFRTGTKTAVQCFHTCSMLYTVSELRFVYIQEKYTYNLHHQRYTHLYMS